MSRGDEQKPDHEVGRRIRQALERRRAELGISYSEISRRVRSSTPSVLSVMKAEGDMRLSTVVRFAEALDLEVSILFRDTAVAGSRPREVDHLPGLRKTAIAQRLSESIERDGISIENAQFVAGRSALPWRCEVMFANLSVRTYDFYFWTVSHGGKRRSKSEYRIQTKLDHSDSLEVSVGTTILGGYYNEEVDRSGRDAGNAPPPGMEIFVFWDALEHLDLGASSSCQVPFETMYDAYLRGYGTHSRSLGSGRVETIFALRPEYVASYLQAASGGHNLVRADSLSPA